MHVPIFLTLTLLALPWTSTADEPKDDAAREAKLLAGLCARSAVVANDAMSQLFDLEKVSAPTEEAVVKLLRGPDEACRRQAAIALGRIHPLRATPAMSILIQALTSGQPLYQLQALTTLEQMGELARPAKGLIELMAKSKRTEVREAAEAALMPLRAMQPLDRRPLHDFRLVALGTRENVPIAYLLDESGFVHEVRGGETFLTGRIVRVTTDAVEAEGRRVSDDYSIVPWSPRWKLFEGGAPPAVPVVAGEHTGPLIDIDYEGRLSGFAAIVSLYGPVNVIVEAGLASDAPIVAKARRTPWDAMVQHALKSAGVAYRTEKSYARLGTREALDRHPRLPERKYTGSPVTLQFRDVDLPLVGSMLAEIGGVTLDLPQEPSGPVTVSFAEVPWDEALDLVLASHGYVSTRAGDRVSVKPAP